MNLMNEYPTDREFNSRWPYWVRQIRDYINYIARGESDAYLGDYIQTTGILLPMAGGMEEEFEIGDGDGQLRDCPIEIVHIGGGIHATHYKYIRGGHLGMIKIFLFLDNFCYFTNYTGDPHAPEAMDTIYLSQDGANFNGDEGDILALFSYGGLWRELFRTIYTRT